jgi:hypothetical protein
MEEDVLAGWDGWVIGKSADRGRTLVVHAVQPRFYVEMTQTTEDTWKAGAVHWLDPSPPTEDVHQWSQVAGDVFFSWVHQDADTEPLVQ